MTLPERGRLPLLALGIITLLAAVWGGLARLGWDIPLPRASMNAWHGPLMVAGFLGALISLERAVALARLWSFGAPLLIGLGSIITIVSTDGALGSLGRILMTAGSALLVIIFFVAIRRQTEMFVAVMGLGAVSLLVGNLIWITREQPLPGLIPAMWWAGFLVLTIAGERLELSRLLELSGSTLATFLLSTGLYLAGLIVTTFKAGIGMRLAGAGLIVLTLWLFQNDVARRTVRQAGFTRFIAVCLLSGYFWLGVSGVLALVSGGADFGWRYDAVLHSLFLGFTFSMIFGHAPIIFPAVLGLNMTYRPFYYAPLVVLHLTLALRVVGDLAEWMNGRKIGGLLNGLALLLFLASTVYSVVSTRRRTIRPAG